MFGRMRRAPRRRRRSAVCRGEAVRYFAKRSVTHRAVPSSLPRTAGLRRGVESRSDRRPRRPGRFYKLMLRTRMHSGAASQPALATWQASATTLRHAWPNKTSRASRRSIATPVSTDRCCGPSGSRYRPAHEGTPSHAGQWSLAVRKIMKATGCRSNEQDTWSRSLPQCLEDARRLSIRTAQPRPLGLVRNQMLRSWKMTALVQGLQSGMVCSASPGAVGFCSHPTCRYQACW